MFLSLTTQPKQIDSPTDRIARQLSTGHKAVIALTATWIGGFVDTAGYILLSRIYTANMTGNRIEVAVRLTDTKRYRKSECRRRDLARASKELVVGAGMVFRDRREAGHSLAAALREYCYQSDTIVLALPRGGVPVAFEVARELGLPLDAFIVRKLGTPGQEELALGAIASGGTMFINHEVVSALGIARATIERIAIRERQELERRERHFRGDRPPLSVVGKTVILVDDGLATGSSMRAAIQALRAHGPKKIIVAVPVAAAQTCARLVADTDQLICLHAPEKFYAVGEWYSDFSQTTDEEVRDLLDRASAQHAVAVRNSSAP